MPSPHPLRQTQTINYSTATANATRQPSTASTSSSAYSASSNPFGPSRTSTMSSMASWGDQSTVKGHKRGISEASGLHSPTAVDGHTKSSETSPAGSYKSVRLSLKPLAQPPSASLYSRDGTLNSYSDATTEIAKSTWPDASSKSQSPKDKRPTSRGSSPVLSRADSIRATSPPSSLHLSTRGQHHFQSHAPALVSAPDLAGLQRSSTSHLRNLSRLAGDGSSGDFSINSPAEEVTGLHGRRRLQRAGSVRGGP